MSLLDLGSIRSNLCFDSVSFLTTISTTTQDAEIDVEEMLLTRADGMEPDSVDLPEYDDEVSWVVFILSTYQWEYILKIVHLICCAKLDPTTTCIPPRKKTTDAPCTSGVDAADEIISRRSSPKP